MNKTHYILVWRDNEKRHWLHSDAYESQTDAIEDYEGTPRHRVSFEYAIEKTGDQMKVLTERDMDRLLEDYEQDCRDERAHNAALNSVYLTGRI